MLQIIELRVYLIVSDPIHVIVSFVFDPIHVLALVGRWLKAGCSPSVTVI